MKLKFIQVNIYKGKYLESLIDFLKREDPDFISMQEVTTRGFNLSADLGVNLFEVLKNRLGVDGVFHGDLRLVGDESSVFGNAVFSKYKIIKSDILVLKSFRPVTLDELDGVSGEIRGQIDRHLFDAEVVIGGRKIHLMSWHGAWTAPPADTDETLRQAQMVANYVKRMDAPFILGCDSNNVLASKTIGLINAVASNLLIGKDIKQTTHPKMHKIAPRGFLIDFIFTSGDFKLISLLVPQVLVSDHLPVVAELEF